MSVTRAPLFPYELALVNAILALLAVSAIFDNKATALRYQIIMALALLAVGGLLTVRTQRTGYIPTRESTERLNDGQWNLAGWSAVVLVIADIVLAPAMFFS